MVKLQNTKSKEKVLKKLKRRNSSNKCKLDLGLNRNNWSEVVNSVLRENNAKLELWTQQNYLLRKKSALKKDNLWRSLFKIASLL